MPRPPRFDAPGTLHHVYARGVGKCAIYRDDLDRARFVTRLERVLARSGATCLAWSLMPTHFHLLFRTASEPLSNVMQRQLGSYARSFNLRHGRVGYLLQGRFRSIVVQEELYLRVLVRYIHRNPLEAGIVADLRALASYPWTGHGALLGNREPLAFHDVQAVLERFGNSLPLARNALKRWMKIDGDEIEPVMLAAAPGARMEVGILGDESFRERVLARAEVRVFVPAPTTMENLHVIVGKVCLEMDITEKLARSGSPSASAVSARQRIVEAAIARGHRQDEIAEYLGVRQSSISRALHRALSERNS